MKSWKEYILQEDGEGGAPDGGDGGAMPSAGGDSAPSAPIGGGDHPPIGGDHGGHMPPPPHGGHGGHNPPPTPHHGHGHHHDYLGFPYWYHRLPYGWRLKWINGKLWLIDPHGRKVKCIAVDAPFSAVAHFFAP